MSKFLKYFAPSLGGTAVALSFAYVLADQFVVDIPSSAPIWVSPAQADEASVAAPESLQMAAAPAASVGAAVPSGPFGLGRAALPEEIAAWDLDVRPDGTGLPEGSGDVLTGEEVFADYCAACHGDFAEGKDNWPKLAGGMGTLDREDPLKTVGSYWPYLSTTWDYVNRSMPFGNAQSLQPDEVYAIVAYILYSNDLVDEDFVLSNETFGDVELPNVGGFIMDDRIETEHVKWRGEPCMENCKTDVQVTMHARVLDVTPTEEAATPTPVAATTGTEAAPTAVEAAAPTAAAAPAAVEAVAASDQALDPELVAAGEVVFKKCKACHQVGEGAVNKTGPALNGIVGHPAGASEGFKYSNALISRAEEGLVWDEEALTAFLNKPKDFLSGTKMAFAGLKKAEDLEAIIAYLKSIPR